MTEPSTLPLRPFACLLLVGLTGACATTGSTLRSGVADVYFDHPPFYAGDGAATTRIAHLPIAYQRGATQPPGFEPPVDAAAVTRLLAEMNAYLADRIGGTVRLGAGPDGTPPDVRFGCPADAVGDCPRNLPPDQHNSPPFHLSVGRPSSRWIAGVAAALDSAGADQALVITLEIGQYYPRQRNVAGAKEVYLGTDYSVNLPWLTSLNDAIQVVQLTGALVGRDGRAVRIGAEGLLARPSPLLVSAVGAQSMVREQDIEQLRSLRRTDVTGQPLVWEVALRRLVAGLTGRPRR